MSVSIEKETAKELITFKLSHIQKEIHSILNKWEENNSDDFISKAKSGALENAEMDAISVRQLVADYKRLKDLLESIKSV
ncbi:MAG: hypothetical protein BAJALOKI3v1_1050001 [Promethearchaeota archaeon]|jgi:hypothetical protein|nr:MAG: hypothetical protein BAJALOKI3v1_1050001 [Candidatus Lokiarchaeota archaeon]